jgi:hypothetical protein
MNFSGAHVREGSAFRFEPSALNGVAFVRGVLGNCAPTLRDRLHRGWARKTGILLMVGRIDEMSQPAPSQAG